MSKYRGKVEGEARGPYRSCVLEAVLDISSEKYNEVGDFFLEEIDPYLSRAGKRMLVISDERDVHGFYHFGGASLYAFFSSFWHRRTQEDAIPSLLQFNLVSNDPLDDVAERLRHRFPYLSAPKKRSDQW